MAKGTYIGVGGAARKVKKEYAGVSGVARKVKKGYVGISGTARPFFTGTPDFYWFSGVFSVRRADDYNWYDQSASPTPYVFHRTGQTRGGVYNKDSAKELSVDGTMYFNPGRNNSMEDYLPAGTNIQLKFDTYAGNWLPRYAYVEAYGKDRIGTETKIAYYYINRNGSSGGDNVSHDVDYFILSFQLSTDMALSIRFRTMFQDMLPSAVAHRLVWMSVDGETIYSTDQIIPNPW